MIAAPRRILLALVCLALCGFALAACGGDDKDEGPRELLRQTFDESATALANGRLNLRFQLDPEGLLALGGPIAVNAAGPFAAPRGAQLPRFDVAGAVTLAGQRFRGGALSTGRQAFVRLDERTYVLDDPAVGRLREDLKDRPRKPQAALRSLGIDPLRWISKPQEKGEERVGGVETIRVGGDVDVARLLEDLDRLLSKAGGSRAGGADALLTPTVRRQIAAGAKSAKADVWTGAEDKLLRQLTVAATFAFGQGRSPIEGLDGGRIALRLRLDGVNETRVSTPAPRGAPPLSRLTGGRVGNVVRGVRAGLEKGTLGVPGAGLVRCITGAQGSSVSLVRCLSKLAP